MSKCIWYVSKYVAPPGKGSAGGRGFLLMEEFARLGYRSVIITSDSNELTQTPILDRPYVMEEIDGVQLWWVRTLKYKVAKSVRRILSWLHFEWRLWLMPKRQVARPDVVIASSLSLLTILNGLWLRRRYGCRLVFEIRDIWPLTLTEEGGYSPRNPIVRGLAWLERLGYSRADAIVGTMPNLGEHVNRVLGYEKPVGCIPMGVDESMVLADDLPEEYAAKYIPRGKFVVVHAGTIGITNALDTFMECAATLVDHKSIHFLMVGDGDLREAYRAKYGHLENLSFAPKVPKKMVQSVLVQCDLLYFSVHKSEVWRFGQSLNKVIDYMLAGKPVVASYSGFPSMINEANCGGYVPSGDVPALREAIIQYCGLSEAERASIGARGRQWILEHRNYHSLAEDYLEILFPKQLRAIRS